MKLKKINQHFFQKDSVDQIFILLKDEIDYETVTDIMESIISENVKKDVYDAAVAAGLDLEELDPPAEAINLFLSSPGGNVTAAFSLISFMEASDIPVRTIALGECGSAAFLILMKGHQRVSTPYCSLLSHQFSSALEASYGNMKSTMQEYNNFHDKICDLYVSATGSTRGEVEKHLLRDVDVWLTPEEALKFGVVDLVSDLK